MPKTIKGFHRGSKESKSVERERIEEMRELLFGDQFEELEGDKELLAELGEISPGETVVDETAELERQIESMGDSSEAETDKMLEELEKSGIETDEPEMDEEYLEWERVIKEVEKTMKEGKKLKDKLVAKEEKLLLAFSRQIDKQKREIAKDELKGEFKRWLKEHEEAQKDEQQRYKDGKKGLKGTEKKTFKLEHQERLKKLIEDRKVREKQFEQSKQEQKKAPRTKITLDDLTGANRREIDFSRLDMSSRSSSRSAKAPESKQKEVGK